MATGRWRLERSRVWSEDSKQMPMHSVFTVRCPLQSLHYSLSHAGLCVCVLHLCLLTLSVLHGRGASRNKHLVSCSFAISHFPLLHWYHWYTSTYLRSFHSYHRSWKPKVTRSGLLLVGIATTSIAAHCLRPSHHIAPPLLTSSPPAAASHPHSHSAYNTGHLCTLLVTFPLSRLKFASCHLPQSILYQQTHHHQ